MAQGRPKRKELTGASRHRSFKLPRSKNPEAYSPHFFTIANAVAQRPELIPFTIKKSSKRDAQSLRFNWYDFVRALAYRNHSLLRSAQKLSVSIKAPSISGDPWLVVFDLRGAAAGDEILEALNERAHALGTDIPQYVPQQPRPLAEPIIDLPDPAAPRSTYFKGVRADPLDELLAGIPVHTRTKEGLETTIYDNAGKPHKLITTESNAVPIPYERKERNSGNTHDSGQEQVGLQPGSARPTDKEPQVAGAAERPDERDVGGSGADPDPPR